MKDILDILLKSINLNDTDDISEYILQPNKYKNNGGQDLFAYQPNDMHKASMYYNHYRQKLNFDKANEILQEIKVSITIQEMSQIYKEALFKNINRVEFLKGKSDLLEIFVVLCSKFFNKTEAEIYNLIEKSDDIYCKNWSSIVHDEDTVTPAHLYRFYNSLEFPVGCLFPTLLKSDLTIAYRALPILLANANKCKRVFDFGGNSGETIAAIASSCNNIDKCYLIEENEVALNFAKWRDELLEIKNIDYIKESELTNSLNDLQESFDFGICTEVLEHVYYVEDTVETISKLLKKGGILYCSASFGQYPSPSHLKKNVKYHGREDLLMSKYGLHKIAMDFPIPLLQNIWVYIKE